MRFQDRNSTSLFICMLFSLFCFVFDWPCTTTVVILQLYLLLLLLILYVLCVSRWILRVHFPTCPFIYTLNIYSCVAYGIFSFRYTLIELPFSFHISHTKKKFCCHKLRAIQFYNDYIAQKMKTEIKWNENKWNVNHHILYDAIRYDSRGASRTTNL